MFLQESDLTQQIYNETLNAITREDPIFISTNIARAISEIDSYLNQKYNVAFMWAQEAEDRDPLVLGLAIDVTLYHMYAVTEEIPVIIRERYDYAKTTLRDIMKGLMKLSSVPLLSDDNDTANDQVQGGGINTRW